MGDVDVASQQHYAEIQGGYKQVCIRVPYLHGLQNVLVHLQARFKPDWGI